MSSQGIDGRSRLAIWLGGVARAACGGMLGTALSFIIGRTGSLFTVALLGTVFFASNILFGPLWGALGDATGRRSDVLIAGSGLATLSLVGLLFAGTNRGLLGVRTAYAVFTVGSVRSCSPPSRTSSAAGTRAERRGSSTGRSPSVTWAARSLSAPSWDSWSPRSSSSVSRR